MKSNDKISSFERLTDFINGFAGSAELLNNAWKNGAFIEAVCVSANLIDGLLRIGIILKRQIIHNHKEIDVSLIYQESTDKTNEKDLYKKALDECVIKKIVYDELLSLYKERNRVVHRYIITELTTKNLLEIAIRYSEMLETIKIIVTELEIEQIKTGKGITASNPSIEKTILYEDIKKSAKEKHGGLNLDGI